MFCSVQIIPLPQHACQVTAPPRSPARPAVHQNSLAENALASLWENPGVRVGPVDTAKPLKKLFVEITQSRRQE